MYETIAGNILCLYFQSNLAFIQLLFLFNIQYIKFVKIPEYCLSVLGLGLRLFTIGLIICSVGVLCENQVRAQYGDGDTEDDDYGGVSLDRIDVGGLDGFIDNMDKSLDSLLSSKPLDKLDDLKCLASWLTAGVSGIERKGQLIIGTNCDDKINGDTDDEIIYTLVGVDTVFAGMGNDIIFGGSGDDSLYGEGDDDIIMPGDGTNLVDGGPGNDILYGALGKNFLVGGDGNDKFIAGAGSTVMDGGPGSNDYDCAGNSIVLDYNPDRGDTMAGKCKIVNNIRIDFPSD
jgi:hypothetical protein